MTVEAPERRSLDDTPLKGNRAPIGVVLVNWHGLRDTLECLESLAASSPFPARVVVVDNASGDDALDHLERWASDRSLSVTRGTAEFFGSPDDGAWLTLIGSSTNTGFCGGNNIGVALLARDPALEHFLLLNNDTTVAPDFFAAMLDAARSGGRVGLVGSTIYEADGRRLWYAGGISLPLRALIEHRHEPPSREVPVDTEFVCGCVMLITRATLETLGPLAECYFPGFCEDQEYCHRARAAGFRLVYAPRARVVHKVGASFGSAEERPSSAYALVRHRTFFVRRNLRGWHRFAALGYLVVTKPARALVEVLRGRPRLGWAFVRGLAAGLFSSAARS